MLKEIETIWHLLPDPPKDAAPGAPAAGAPAAGAPAVPVAEPKATDNKVGGAQGSTNLKGGVGPDPAVNPDGACYIMRNAAVVH